MSDKEFESKLINLEEIDLANEKFQMRKKVGAMAVAIMANNITSKGLLEPVIVMKQDDNYIVVSGFTRLKAITEMKNSSEENFTTAYAKYFSQGIPVRVIKLADSDSKNNDMEILSIALSTNTKRTEVRWDDEYNTINIMYNHHLESYTGETKDYLKFISEKTGNDRPKIALYLKVREAIEILETSDEMFEQNTWKGAKEYADKVIDKAKRVERATSSDDVKNVHKELGFLTEDLPAFEKPVDLSTVESLKTETSTDEEESPEELKWHKVLNMDVEKLLVKTEFDSIKFDCFTADPPYGIDMQNSSVAGRSMYDDRKELFDEFLEDFPGIVKKFADSKGSGLVWFSMSRYVDLFAMLNTIELPGLKVCPKCIIWDKNGAGFKGSQYFPKFTYETALLFSWGDHVIDDFKTITNEALGKGTNKIHEAQKPYQFMRSYLNATRATHHMDLYSGSGSAVVGALGSETRISLGIESSVSIALEANDNIVNQAKFRRDLLV